MKTDYPGKDYGCGKTNIDKNGIRFSVIPQNDILQQWANSSESEHGEPGCPYCGCPVETDGKLEIECPDCGKSFPTEDAWGDTPIGFYFDNDGYQMRQDSDSHDVWVTKSPYFTYAQLCSPCAPGACHLSHPLNESRENNKCYCLGHDWFDNGAPYNVYSVETGAIVKE